FLASSRQRCLVPGHERADTLKNTEHDGCRASQKLPCTNLVAATSVFAGAVHLFARSVSYAAKRFLPTLFHCNSCSTRRRPCVPIFLRSSGCPINSTTACANSASLFGST